jgi:signal transduction histidine kinase
VDGTTPPAVVEAVDASAGEIRESIRELRGFLVDIYPPSLAREGLVAALGDLRTRTATPGRSVEVQVPPDLRLPAEAEALLFRAAQEALRNVVKHADASLVTVSLARENGHAELVVADDGRGFSPVDAPADGASGHFGLRALEDLVGEHGGTMDVASAPREGTRVTVTVPVE